MFSFPKSGPRFFGPDRSWGDKLYIVWSGRVQLEVGEGQQEDIQCVFLISMDASHVNAKEVGSYKMHSNPPWMPWFDAKTIQCSSKFARISGRKSQKIWKSALPLQVPDEKTSTEDELHFVCALWGWFMSCESFVDLVWRFFTGSSSNIGHITHGDSCPVSNAWVPSQFLRSFFKANQNELHNTNKQQHRVVNCRWTRAFNNFIENVDPGLIERRRAQTIRNPASSSRNPACSLRSHHVKHSITSNSKWHCDDNTKAYHEEYDMSISTVRHEMLNILLTSSSTKKHPLQRCLQISAESWRIHSYRSFNRKSSKLWRPVTVKRRCGRHCNDCRRHLLRCSEEKMSQGDDRFFGLKVVVLNNS